jgi:hypothetical protein
MNEEQMDAGDRVRLAYRLTVTREPSDKEVQAAVGYIEEMDSILRDQKQHNQDHGERLAWASFCQSLFASSEFRYVN